MTSIIKDSATGWPSGAVVDFGAEVPFFCVFVIPVPGGVFFTGTDYIDPWSSHNSGHYRRGEVVETEKGYEVAGFRFYEMARIPQTSSTEFYADCLRNFTRKVGDLVKERERVFKEVQPTPWDEYDGYTEMDPPERYLIDPSRVR